VSGDLPIGIDLGTTYSAVAVVGPTGKPAIVVNREGESITPSVVLYQGDLPMVGTSAKRSAPIAPDDVVQFVKRHMGDATWRFTSSSGQEYTAEQVSAAILRRLKDDAELMLGRPCPEAVITVPAYFDDARRRATADAGAIAGFTVLRVLNEPTAAALAYGLEELDAGTCLVYDLGGGTFDVTVLRIQNGDLEVLATIGERNLGGFDFDNALMQHVAAEVLANGGPDLLDGEHAEADLRDKCELAKRTLSTMPEARVFVTANGTHHNVVVSRTAFEGLTKNLLDRTELMLEEACEAAGVAYYDLDKVLLVGGSTRMPMVAELIRRALGKEAELGLNPDEAVALGAAVQAALLAPGETSPLDTAVPLTVRDVTSQALGVVAVEETPTGMREHNSIIIAPNTKVPCQASSRFTTTVDGQTRLDVQVTEGDDEDLAYVTVVGSTVLTIPPYPKGAPIEIVMSYDFDGMIHVGVVDLTTNENLGEFEVDREANLDKADVERMRQAMARTEVR
jgi:molecular chaperone DnaK